MSTEEKSTFLKKLRGGARSLLFTNTLLVILVGSNLIPWVKPPNTSPASEQTSISKVLRKNEWKRNRRDEAIRIQDRIEADKQKLATDKLDQSQLLNINNSLIESADSVEAILIELKNQPPPKDSSKTIEFDAFKQRVERLEKLLVEIKKKLDEEKRRSVDGASSSKTSIYDRAESLADVIREILELKDFFLFANMKKEFVNAKVKPKTI